MTSVARVLVAVAAVVWVVAACAYAGIADSRVSGAIGALLLGATLAAVARLARDRPRAAGASLVAIASVLWAGLLVGDDDTRRLRALFFAGLYPQTDGRQDYAFHGPGAWGWPTVLLAVCVACVSIAAVLLLAAGGSGSRRLAGSSQVARRGDCESPSSTK